jgi:type VI secretion system protein ImpL
MHFLKRILSSIAQPWFIVLIGIILLSLIVWFIGPLIAVADHVVLESETLRLAIIFVIFIAWGLNNLRQKHSDQKSSKELAENLIADSQQDNKQLNSVKTQDESILSTRLNDAINMLQGSRFGKGNKLYTLPWYMIIGAPGSGKTTALKNSGLKFPLSSKFGDDPIQGTGGTRHCDWWFTNEAILIDTAGRYTTQDNPKNVETHAWRGFLNRLKSTRPKRPLNGIVLTISMHDILQKTATQKTIQTTAIKRRIQELNNHLGMELPVYVVFTKTDIVAGFNSFFADLEKEEREQVWGFTYPDTKAVKTGDLLEKFDEQYSELMQRINNRVLIRLNHERNPKRRALVYEFPRQMNALKQPLYEFLGNIFIPNQFEAPFALRGTYFISSTQTHTASQWVSGILPPDQCESPIDVVTKDPKTFFVNHLFKRIIFAEANIAKVNNKAQHRHVWLFRSAVALSLLTFVGFVSAWHYSKRLNSAYIEDIGDSLTTYRESTKGGLENQHSWLDLVRGLNQLKSLPTGFDNQDENQPLLQGLGLYQGDKLGSQAQSTYLRALESFFMRDLDVLLTKQIDRSSTDDQLYESLRFYLMLYYPEKMNRDAFTAWINILWERKLPSDPNPVLRDHLNTHLTIALDRQSAPAPINTELVAQSRETLISTPLDLRLYRRLKNDYMHENNKQFSVSQVLGKKADFLFYRRSNKPLTEGVPELFTYKGFHTGFNLQNIKLTENLTDEQWIYGDSLAEPLTKKQIKAIRERINSYYFAEYNTRWEQLINDLAIRSFNSVNRGQSVIQLLTGSDRPLVKLLNRIRENTALSEAPNISDSNKALAKSLSEALPSNQTSRLERLVPKNVDIDIIALPGAQVTDNFDELNSYINSEQGFPLERLQQSLNTLNDYIQSLAYAPNVNQAAFQSRLGSQEGNKVMSGMRRTVVDAPPEIQDWFSSITRDTEKVTTAAIRNHMNDVWNKQVVSLFNQSLKGRYPINPKSLREINLADFSTMFGPQGVLASFSKEFIEPFVDTSQSRWRWNKNMGLPHQSLRVFEQAQRIRQAYFNGSSSKPQVAFTLKPVLLDRSVATFLLDIAGTSVVYRHGPVKTEQVVWPGENTDLSKIVFTLVSKGTPVSARARGQWSWFRLLDRYAKRRSTRFDDSVNITFEVSGIQAQYELKPESTYNPYNNNELINFNLPKRL